MCGKTRISTFFVLFFPTQKPEQKFDFTHMARRIGPNRSFQSSYCYFDFLTSFSISLYSSQWLYHIIRVYGSQTDNMLPVAKRYSHSISEDVLDPLKARKHANKLFRLCVLRYTAHIFESGWTFFSKSFQFKSLLILPLNN